MATLNLGRIKPVFQGAYNNSTAYVVDDIVTFGNETFICILASTGNATSNATYWTKLAAKGTDGTDVGTTLTTQGDILYRDGSGLARLGYGTAGQVLQTGGSGANPSWGTISSDCVKVAEFSHTSGLVTNFNLDNIFSATYPVYRVIFHDMLHNGTGSQGWLRAIENNGNTDSGNSYEMANNGRTSGGTDLTGSSSNQSYVQLSQDLSSDTEKTSTIVVDIVQPYQTSAYKWFGLHSFFYCNNSSDMRYLIGGGVWKNNSTQMRGLTYTAQGTSNYIKRLKAVVYGFKGAY